MWINNLHQVKPDHAATIWKVNFLQSKSAKTAKNTEQDILILLEMKWMLQLWYHHPQFQVCSSWHINLWLCERVKDPTLTTDYGPDRKRVLPTARKNEKLGASLTLRDITHWGVFETRSLS